jgi:hypothetical protein
MSETHMERKTDIPALREALAKATPISGSKITSHHIVSKGYEHMANLCRESMGCIAMTFKEESDAIAAAYTALPALLDELEELRRMTTPEVIGEQHKKGDWWWVWDKWAETWRKGRWSFVMECWVNPGGEQLVGFITHALPMPGEPHA